MATLAGCGVVSIITLPSNIDPDIDVIDDDPSTPDDPTDPSNPDNGTTDPDIPDSAYCEPVADWPAEWDAFEEEVLQLVNERRAAGADCGGAGTFGPAPPLTMNPALRCAARNHSMDMFVRDYFSHTNPDGDGPGQRIDYAGYDGFTWGENIAWGYATPQIVVANWMDSDGHCANIMRPSFTETGVGFYDGNFWTQTFGAR